MPPGSVSAVDDAKPTCLPLRATRYQAGPGLNFVAASVRTPPTCGGLCCRFARVTRPPVQRISAAPAAARREVVIMLTTTTINGAARLGLFDRRRPLLGAVSCDRERSRPL